MAEWENIPEIKINRKCKIFYDAGSIGLCKDGFGLCDHCDKCGKRAEEYERRFDLKDYRKI